MKHSMENPNFLKKKYDLHNAPEVEAAAERTERRTGEEVPDDPARRIQNYLDRFKEITERQDPDKRERGMRALKEVLHDQCVIKEEDIPESYFKHQQQVAREQGHGDIDITEELKDQAAEVLIADQESTLDNWVDYLASTDAPYPDWLKYWTIRSVLAMGAYDKEKKTFAKRSQGTVTPFPDINREALAYVLDAVSQKYGKRHTDLLALSDEEKKAFETLLQQEHFPKLYAWALEKTALAPTESLERIEGEWVKYEKGSDHLPLVASLQGYGTGWCTAGESTARIQLQGGDFWVYYSLDKDGNSTIPRAAIRMEENRIAEVRGVAKEQNLDAAITPIVQAKLAEFPDGASYEKKTKDMQELTDIERKMEKGDPLTTENLRFLYELDRPIEGFGYQRDPRIKTLRDRRNPEEDMPIIFECTKDHIAHRPEEITKDTKAYVGKLEPGIFRLTEHIDHIYTSFPEGRIRKEELTLEGTTGTALEKELVRDGIKISEYAKDMLRSKEFIKSEHKEQIALVRLRVQDLFPDAKMHTTKEIYDRAELLGLALCPHEVGPQYRLKYTDQPLGEWFWIGMESITDRDGGPRVFRLARDGDGLWLYSTWAEPAAEWDPDGTVVFRSAS